MTLPLENIKVLDLGTQTPGKFCTFLLGDLGAEVIRIERPVPPGTPESSRLSDEDLLLNRNKRSITINMRSEEGRKIFYQLSEKVDVILESYRPGVTRRMGVDYETIKEINPRIIYCALSGYGQDGPYSQLPAFDLVFTAIAGLLTLIGGRSRPPVVPGLYLSDMAAGWIPTIGILAALLAREKTGQGQFIDIAMLDGALSWLSMVHGVEYPSADSPPDHEEPVPMDVLPGYNIYETKDARYIALGIYRQQSWESLCRALNREDLVDQQWAVGEKREEILAFFQNAFRTKTRNEWFEQLKALDIEVGPVNTPEEAFADPQVQYRRMVLEVDHPIKGKARQLGIPIKFSETPGEVRRAAPFIGQDTEEILQALGHTRAQVEELRKAQVV